MSNTSSTSPELPEPIELRPHEMVMAIYPVVPPTIPPMADRTSAIEARHYLRSRYDEEPTETRIRLAGQETTIKLPSFKREEVGLKQVTRLGFSDKWLIRPSVALAATIASFGGLALDGSGFHPGQNAENLGKAIDQTAQVIGHKIYRIFEPVQNHTITTKVPVPPVHIQVQASSTNRAGEFTINTGNITKLASEVNADMAKGDKPQFISIEAEASDEYGSDQSIGRVDKGNIALAQKRAEAAGAAVKSVFAKSVLGQAIEMSVKENVLSPATKASLTAEAKADGFSDLYTAVIAEDKGQVADPKLAKDLKDSFQAKRGVIVEAVLAQPGKPKIEKHTVKGKDDPPTSPNWHIMPFIPLPPLKRLERRRQEKVRHHWRYNPTTIIRTPRLIIENLENAWVRLRPEALQPDKTLRPNPWAYSRKLEHIFRDDLITKVLRADFKDEKGQDRALRIMFVAHEPQPETLTRFAEALERFCAIQKGRLADKISGIFVYPTRYAGDHIYNPKRLGLGVDQQLPEEIMGTCTPILELVELHMPDDEESADLLQLLDSFDGAYWTLAHEVAGHGSDIKDARQRLIPVRLPGLPNAYIIDGQPWRSVMRPLRNTLRKLSGRRAALDQEPKMFDIEYEVRDLNGQRVVRTARVPEGDPRLSHALSARIVGFRNTNYAGQDDEEHHAETTAHVFTGINVPFAEADVEVDQLPTREGELAQFTPGYRPDRRAHRQSNTVLGARLLSYPSEFDDMPEVAISLLEASQDELLHQQMERARTRPFPRPHDLIAILARIRQKKK